MKIGIITITQGTNYGNRLQIYALQKVLKSIGHDSYLIKDNTYMHGVSYQFKRIIKLLIGYKNERAEYKRLNSYKKFDSKYLVVSKHKFDENYMKSNIADYFDAFVCGSDQIWNPHFPYLNGGCFADFPGAKLRISYAASFGESSIQKDLIEKYKKWLGGMHAISVREESGAFIVKELIDKKVDVHIDPTMMLDAEDWVKIEEAPKIKPRTSYVFKYFLGEVKSEVSTVISKIANDNGYEIVDVLPAPKNKNYSLNPSNFIYLLHHAEFVITDSFHATVFAILFNKPVRVFDRVDKKLNMTSRLDTLLSLFNCEEIRNNYNLDTIDKLISFDKSLLLSKRQKSKEYLIKTLGDGRKL